MTSMALKTAPPASAEDINAQLRLRMASFEAFVAHAPFAAALIDRSGRLAAVSAEWRDEDLTPDLAPGEPFARCLMNLEDVESLERCLASGEPFSRYRAQVVEGAQRIWRSEFAACRSDEGIIFAVIVTARDVTGYADRAAGRAQRAAAEAGARAR